MKKYGIVTIILIIGIVAALVALSALSIMVLINVILTHYDARTLDYRSALAVTGLLIMLSGSINANRNSGD